MRRWVRSPSYRIAIAKLVDARNKAGLSQRDLAEKIGKPHSFVAKIENGERRLDLIEFISIVRALGVGEAEMIRVIGGALPKRIDLSN